MRSQLIATLVLLGLLLLPVSQAFGQEDETEGEEAVAVEEESGDSLLDEIGPALGLTLLGGGALVGGIAYLVDTGTLNDAAEDPIYAGLQTSIEERADRHQGLGITLTTLGVGMIGTAVYLWVDTVQEYNARGEEEGEVSFRVTPTLNAQSVGIDIFGSF